MDRFPREGNNWSFKYARRQWNLAENNDLKYYSLQKFDRKMLKLHTDFKILDDLSVNKIYDNNADKVIAYMRGELLFVFNFNPNISFTDYGIPVTGKFKLYLILMTPHLDGFDRIDRKTIYISIRKAERNIINAPLYLYLYLPARTALVFKKEPVRKATDI
jgi:1,4-alpha-glucan branching enzyme